LKKEGRLAEKSASLVALVTVGIKKLNASN
jgi:hypothetical protein